MVAIDLIDAIMRNGGGGITMSVDSDVKLSDCGAGRKLGEMRFEDMGCVQCPKSDFSDIHKLSFEKLLFIRQWTAERIVRGTICKWRK
jgi:hypothetical protein